ncbi:estradiol 17-beta-dehydrogenase 12-A [Colletotrichum higginsianum]|uniref:Estradiol 17-beta-dehydrogenase 12-A n=1 Tax=Colletotrichum higginsianum (strain IMI 349063) TaxID=759273 RepID=H1VJ43_COLHI|nr:Estradiol 17-beta-dehydrogenase 12-A [Colletotrichum higginsianum IMI 349063]OBR13112.1 Estradiol 17-beta-dehydrogenase 12-A [Colletotrichum higginsianum IMI 349063]CCF40246.1 estradiol 17-beta-dehydrogenase 12-A [Colletotrichum higginsianum]
MESLGFLPTVGLLALLAVAYNLSWPFFPFVRKSALDRYRRTVNGRPAWALVTGASDGIGKGLADELARRGFNVVIHGRNDVKLEGVRHDLAARHPGREFRIMVGDAVALGAGAPLWDVMLAPLENLNLRVLVNNVGGVPMVPVMRRLDESTVGEIADNVHMNALFPTLLSSILLPRLTGPAEPALIVNVGSLADVGPPLLSFYGGSKAYMNALSTSMAEELALDGVDVEVLGMRVGPVATRTELMQPRVFWPSAETMAQSILDRVGGKKTKQYETDLSNKEKQVTQERVHLDTCVKENAVPLTKWFHLMSSNSVYGSA